ncbi:alpha-S1-casein precursor [Sus scrofa]|uniref:Alpha-S1-casein n=2 Tax=Sus scrofa TaxID=9823 RepID=CASA1_PIG|nr:alpha-S1-casein precursor [Sus scrofa]P39035.1 RecName: Full=Alpha-S1-casein; Flags: Precursor [Sus scrofa]ABV22547.1 alpha S1 casein [Sus scrofa]CAA38717.1 alpha(s1) casein [Sus scrofa]
MKLLIFICLAAVALARPKPPLRHQEHLQNEPDSREELFKERKFLRFPEVPLLSQFRQEIINELNRNHGMEGHEQRGSSSSSSEEVVGNSAEQKHVQKEEDVPSQSYLGHLQGLNKYKLRQLEAIHDQELHRTNEDKHTQQGEPMKGVNQEQAYFYFEPLHQFYQLDAYPYATWYYPPQYIAHPLFTNIPQPTAPEKGGKTEIMPQW